MSLPHLDLVHIPLTGSHLIEASAGTGKTYSITGLYLRMVLESGLRLEEILVVTYTEAACQELREAIRNRLTKARLVLEQRLTGTGNEAAGNDSFLAELFDSYEAAGKDLGQLASRLRLAATEVDLSAIYTIHGFCMRVLQAYAFEGGFPFEMEFVETDKELLQQCIDEYWMQQSHQWSPLFAAYLCQKNLFPESCAELMARLLKIVMVAGEEAISFSAVSEPLGFDGSYHQQLVDLWSRYRHELAAELSSSPALGRAEKTYRQDNLDRWCRELDHFLIDQATDIAPIEAIAKLSSTALAAGAKKGKADAVPRHAFFTLCDTVTADLVSAKNGLLVQLLQHCQQALGELKRVRGLVSFDDLLTGVRDALRRPATGPQFAVSICQKYPVALIDEFQDTDPVQYEIFQKIYLHNSLAKALFLVGDPKQAIYGFRGADIFAYLAAACSKVDGGHSLVVNWRSEPGLITACNSLFSQGRLPPFILPEITFTPAQAPVETRQRRFESGRDFTASMTLAIFEDQPDRTAAYDHIGGWLADQIAGLLAPTSEAEFVEEMEGVGRTRRPVMAADIAILVRTHKEGELVQNFLEEYGIHAVIQAKASVFQSLEAREVGLILEAVLDPANDRCLRAALTTRLLGQRAHDFLAMEESGQWEEWLQRFLEYNRLWQERGVAPMLYTLLNAEGSFVRISKGVGGERALTNVRHLIELLQQVAHERGLKPAMLIQWMAESRHEPGAGDTHQIRLESDEDLVQIVTVHKSKGLQYPVVFCPFLWDSRLGTSTPADFVVYHDEAGRLAVDFDTNQRDVHLQSWQKEALAEELRLLYVALTRARNRCVITWGRVFSKNKCRTATSALQYCLSGFAGMGALTDAPVEALQAYFAQRSVAEWRRVFEALSRASGGNIGLVDIVEPSGQMQASRQREAVPGKARKFDRFCVDQRLIHSFSSLHSQARARVVESPDYDGLPTDLAPAVELPAQPVRDIFSFPRGARAGTCLHAIFEELDFQETDLHLVRQLVDEKLATYGFELEWAQPVTRFIDEMRSVTLGGTAQNLVLKAISRQKRLAEMEFYYALPTLPAAELQALFFGKRQEEIALKGSGGGCFMKGFVDLIFEWQGRFYILDYKSNFLGATYDDYHRDKLATVMESAGYDLQYKIYTIALHRYLSRRLPGYVYDSHFGGVYYLFLRGLHPSRGAECGVYFERPAWPEIEMISQHLMVL